MSTPFIDRYPTPSEIERFRLFLSSYQTRLVSFGAEEPVSFYLLADIISSAFNIPISNIYPFYKEGNDTSDRYRIYLKSLLVDNNNNFGRGKIVKTFDFSTYWGYLSDFGINQENYRDKASDMGIASMHLIYGKKMNFEKSTCLLFSLGNYMCRSNNDKINFSLAQYPYFIDPTKLDWLCVNDEVHSPIRNYKRTAIFLRGYEGQELIFEIRMRPPAFTSKHNFVMSILKEIEIYYSLAISKKIWFSEVLHMEALSDFRIMEYGVIAIQKKRREKTIAELEELINQDAKEEKFQQILEENPWIFGNEYERFLDKREIIPGTQQDLLARRTADNHLEIIEIKRSLNGKTLFHEVGGGIFYPGADLSKAIGQAIYYIDKAEGYKHNILAEKKEDVNKIKAKIVIGRDGDENQQRAMHNLNSHLHGIEVFTYDQLLRSAKRSLTFQ